MDSVFTVDGTAPSSIDTGLQVLGASGTDTSITVGFDVSDVTGNDEIDLFMRGGLMDWSTSGLQSSVFVRKSGAGTMALLAENTFGKSTKGVFAYRKERCCWQRMERLMPRSFAVLMGVHWRQRPQPPTSLESLKRLQPQAA